MVHRDLERELGPRPLLGGLLRVLLVDIDKLHYLVGGHAQVHEFLEYEIIEDEPREIRAVEESFILPERLFEVLERAAAQRALAANEFVEKNLFLAPRAGCVRGLHA